MFAALDARFRGHDAVGLLAGVSCFYDTDAQIGWRRSLNLCAVIAQMNARFAQAGSYTQHHTCRSRLAGDAVRGVGDYSVNRFFVRSGA